MLNLFLVIMLVLFVFVRALKLPSFFGRIEPLIECRVPNSNHLHSSRAYFRGRAYSRGFSSQTTSTLSQLITIDHLREPYVLTFHISNIEDNVCFKFGWGGGGGGGGAGFPLFQNFPALII